MSAIPKVTKATSVTLLLQRHLVVRVFEDLRQHVSVHLLRLSAQFGEIVRDVVEFPAFSVLPCRLFEVCVVALKRLGFVQGYACALG